MTTRRSFLKTGSLAAIAVAGQSSRRYHYPALLRAATRTVPLGDLPKATDPQFKELAMRALDAAKSGGASYADVRFTVTRQRTFKGQEPVEDGSSIAMGVRALSKGAWGFSAHTNLTPDIAATLGSKATELAQMTAWPRVPPIQLTDRPAAAVGHWEMPVKRDPFKVPIEEVSTLIEGIYEQVRQYGADKLALGLVFIFQRQDRVFASTDGAYATQTVYTSLANPPHIEVPSHLIVGITDNGKEGQYKVPIITPTGAGYEVVDDAKILESLPEWQDKARELANAKDFDKLGRYDVVFDADAMAAIVDGTLGAALEYDRAVGYEANAWGTSYMAPPLNILGTSCAPAAVTVTADRTMPGGCATVKWDDEGVTPHSAPLVKDGVVVDYATSREFVSELAPWYQKRGETVRSNGCAASESAFTVPLVYTPNLTLQPGAKDLSVADLVAKVDDGMLVCGGKLKMDFQQTSGRGGGEALIYAIKHGKLADPIGGCVYAFNTKELWKNLVSLGGAKTAGTFGISAFKGQPNQGTAHSVKAVAAHFQQVQFDYESTG